MKTILTRFTPNYDE